MIVETKRSADSLEYRLAQQGVYASSIHGDKSQNEREMALREFKAGRTPILVATDVASRGLDIPNVTLVVNYDLPSNVEDYVHRIGRTGRCGNVGHAHSFFYDRNDNIGKELAEMLMENSQEVPEWMEKRYLSRGGSRGAPMGRGGSGRGGKYGATDMRREHGGYGGGGGGGGGSNWDRGQSGGHQSQGAPSSVFNNFPTMGQASSQPSRPAVNRTSKEDDW